MKYAMQCFPYRLEKIQRKSQPLWNSAIYFSVNDTGTQGRPLEQTLMEAFHNNQFYEDFIFSFGEMQWKSFSSFLL